MTTVGTAAISYFSDTSETPSASTWCTGQTTALTDKTASDKTDKRSHATYALINTRASLNHWLDSPARTAGPGRGQRVHPARH